MSGLLQNHRLKDNEPLQVPQSVPYPTQISHQCHHKASTGIPAWIDVAPLGHDRKVTPPPLPHLVVTDSTIKVGVRIGMNPVPVDLQEVEILQGWVVAWNITPLPLRVLRIQRLVAPVPSLCSAGLCSRRGSGVVSSRYFPFTITPSARPCLPPFVLARRPIPFSIPVDPFIFPCVVFCLSCRVQGATLAHCPGQC